MRQPSSLGENRKSEETIDRSGESRQKAGLAEHTAWRTGTGATAGKGTSEAPKPQEEQTAGSDLTCRRGSCQSHTVLA